MTEKQRTEECGFQPQKITDGFRPFVFVKLENNGVEDISIHETVFKGGDFFEI